MGSTNYNNTLHLSEDTNKSSGIIHFGGQSLYQNLAQSLLADQRGIDKQPEFHIDYSALSVHYQRGVHRKPASLLNVWRERCAGYHDVEVIPFWSEFSFTLIVTVPGRVSYNLHFIVEDTYLSSVKGLHNSCNTSRAVCGRGW